MLGQRIQSFRQYVPKPFIFQYVGLSQSRVTHYPVPNPFASSGSRNPSANRFPLNVPASESSASLRSSSAATQRKKRTARRWNAIVVRASTLYSRTRPKSGRQPKGWRCSVYPGAWGRFREGRPGLSCKISLARLGNPQRSLRTSLAGPRAARPSKSL
jgi:hypothetical protein